ncbi:hypothetical protein SEA_TWISTER6_36 [Gordonia phage Twister6]|nr:hypothetical protein BI083_gp36 [Gordonia phage Twister6]YP_010109668.1 hypothetical protein KNV19_gp34 [Gordonia phage Portcullis]AOE44945.1 hypothetical protein SEA_TWISTER6_36 [Gordonia phage Twister6]QNJ56348.1 hypothetical protein SEA_PORTCULLIS_34 [Gordonia phage Portcullis]
MITADHVQALYEAGEGAQLWRHPDGSVRVLHSAPREGIYLMPFDKAWFAQWSGDWNAAAHQLNTITEQEPRDG